jgi:hypothetical protein
MIDRSVPNRHGNRAGVGCALHYHMAAALTNLHKSMPLKNCANFGAGKNAQFTQQSPQRG